MHYQEWSCATQKLDETNTERSLGIDELGRFVWYSVARSGTHCQRLWLKEHQNLNPEDFTSCLRILKHMDKREAVQDVQRLHRMEKRHSHITKNAERETKRSLREP